MSTQLTQRWRENRASYRPAGEPIHTRSYEVAAIIGDAEAKAFVKQHHYSRSYPAARFRFGLYRAGALVGVAVFSHPVNDKTLTNIFPFSARDSVELGRFVLLDDVPSNGETWFLARCFDLLRRETIAGVVSFSDDQPRRTISGRVVFAGHIGTIYQAHNAVYLGRGVARPVRLLPDGRILSARAIQKIRAGEVGWRYSAQLLEDFGAAPMSQPDNSLYRQAWLEYYLPRLTRSIRHLGNHKYAWTLQRRARRVLLSSLSYPKRASEVQQ